ncbi:hypothetical protein Tco_0543611 [Tanacetum coccineum]
MKRPTKGYSGQEVALFPTMLDVTEPSTSPLRITYSPPHYPPSPFTLHRTFTLHSLNIPTCFTNQPSPTQHHQHNSHLEQNTTFLHLMIHLSMLFTHDGSDKGSEARVHNQDWQNKGEKLDCFISDDEDIEDDSSKQGRKLSDAEVQEAEVQEKASTETEPFIQEVTPTKVIQDQGSSEKGSAEVSTVGATKGTASEVPVVSTAEEDISTTGRTVTYTRRIAEKRSRQDKGKAIMIESEPKKKSKKEHEQERLSFAEAIRLEEQIMIKT